MVLKLDKVYSNINKKPFITMIMTNTYNSNLT